MINCCKNFRLNKKETKKTKKRKAAKNKNSFFYNKKICCKSLKLNHRHFQRVNNLSQPIQINNDRALTFVITHLS